MMARSHSTIEHSAPTKTVKATGFQEIYANHLRLGMTPFDIALTFAHILEGENANETYMEEIIAVRLSPQLFKRIAAQFVVVMQAYEAQFGEIKIPEPPSPEKAMAGIAAVLRAGGIPTPEAPARIRNRSKPKS